MSPKVESLRVRDLKEIKKTEKKLKERVTESCQTLKENKSTVDLEILGIDMMPNYDELFAEAD